MRGVITGLIITAVIIGGVVIYCSIRSWVDHPSEALLHQNYEASIAKLAELDAIDQSKDWQAYTALRSKYRPVVHKDLAKIVANTSDTKLAIEAQFEDWKVWEDQSRYEEIEQATENLKRLLLEYVKSGGEPSAIKSVVDGIRVFSKFEPFIQSLYWVYVTERIRSQGPGEAVRLVEAALENTDRPFLQAALDEGISRAMTDYPAAKAMDFSKDLLVRVYTVRKKHEQEIEDAPERYKELQDTKYLYTFIIAQVDKVIGKYQGQPQIDYFLFMAGEARYQLGKFEIAPKYLEELIFKFPESEYFVQAVNRTGNCYSMDSQRYDQRFTEFLDRVYYAYPGHRMAPEILLGLAGYRLQFKDYKRALLEYYELFQKFPEFEREYVMGKMAEIQKDSGYIIDIGKAVKLEEIKQ